MTSRRTLLTGLGASLLAGFTPLPSRASGRAPIGYLTTNWSRDPFARGSYSYVAKGASRRDHRTLAAPAGRLFFAGEATHPRYNSTVHAAYESRLYAAEALAETPAKTVAVIGAGIAGLAAAKTLSDQGYTVTVIEARDRIGGRLLTATNIGPALDLGASWIHGTRGNPLTDLAQQSGAKTVVTGYDYVIRGAGGIIPDAQAPDWLDEVTEIQQSLGASSADINARAYVLDRSYGGDEVIFLGGYSQLLDPLQGGYKTVLSSPVSKIMHSFNGVAVQSPDVQKDFDAAIVTLPLGVLKSNAVTFSPTLPPQKLQAISRLGMGLLDKVYLQFDTAFWDDATWILTTDTGLPPGQFNQWLNLDRILGIPVLCGFNGADPARELAKLPRDQVIDRATQALTRAYGA